MDKYSKMEYYINMECEGFMKVSAVGFLFQNKIKTKGLKGNNYTCIIHKRVPNGIVSKNVISSPLIKESSLTAITPFQAADEIEEQLSLITNRKPNTKFVGATIKDGIKETEIHSIFSDKLFGVRTKDEHGKNHFRIAGRRKTQRVLTNNLNLSV